MTQAEQGVQPGTMERWQRIARRIRVPLGFLTAALYVFELLRHAPRPAAIGWSLLLVAPGLWLRGYAAGYVKKNRELTQTGPYAHTRNPLYVGSILIAAGFAIALLSWAVGAMLAAMFLIIYVPVIASEERFLRANFPDFEAYCRRVPRLIPRFVPQRPGPVAGDPAGLRFHEQGPVRGAAPVTPAAQRDGQSEVLAGKFSLDLYLRHREYNAAIGAALLYLSLLFLRPALGLVVHLPQ